MALIGKIRKNFWLVLVLLGLALAAFIMMDMSGSGGPAGAVTDMTIGEINGEKINYQDFQQTEQAYYRNAQLDAFQKRKNIWDFYVERALINDEADAMGLAISYDELMDLQFGVNQSPVIKSNWTNPQTGQVDQATLQQYRTAIENEEPMNPEFVAYWAEQEKQIVKEALQAKLYSLINKSVYAPSWLAEESFKLENSKVDFDFVKIPFDEIDGSGIEVTDQDIKEHMQKYPAEYKNEEETRVAKLAIFNVEPSATDVNNMMTNMNAISDEFAITENDSIFAISNGGSYSPVYGTPDMLPEVARDQITELQPGEVYGPFEDQDFLFIVKMIDRKPVPDTVEAKHILRTADRANVEAVAEAQAYIDSLKTVYQNGGDFEALAREHSQDPSAATNGGDLGKFTQNTMVREFSEVCFLTGKKGGLYTVTTDYGVHLIKIEDQIFNNDDDKFRISTITQAIIPSQETQDSVYDIVSEIVAQSRSEEDLQKAIDELADPNVTLDSADPVKRNDFKIADLRAGQSSRDIISWMFDSTTERGDISPEVYRYTDPVNYYDNQYVVALLDRIIPKGMKDVDDVREQLQTVVLNRKKGEKLASEMQFTSLQDVAGQYNTEVQSAADVAVLSEFVPGVGSEPEVVGAAFTLDPQSVSQPIVGNSGVFVISPLGVNEAGAANNIPFLKKNLATSTKSQVNFKVLQSLKERAKVEDKRATFF